MAVRDDMDRFKDYKSNLKKVRKIKGYTQSELSNLSGVNLKSISAYEQEPRKLLSASLETVYKLADSLGVEIMDIINIK